MRRVVAARPEDAGRLLACGVTCEGPIDKDVGHGDAAAHARSSPASTLRERVARADRLPTVLATSSQARVIAERWIGAARGVSDVMVLLLSDAVEAGIVSNGRLLLGGRRGNAGQIGHINVEPNGLTCICGAQGCLWAYASAAALQAEMNRPLRRAPAPVVERTGRDDRAGAWRRRRPSFDLRLVLLAGTVPTTFGAPLLEAAARELDQRSRIAFLRSMPDRARPLVQLGVVDLGREAALVGAAGLGRLALRERRRGEAAAPRCDRSGRPYSGSPMDRRERWSRLRTVAVVGRVALLRPRLWPTAVRTAVARDGPSRLVATTARSCRCRPPEYVRFRLLTQYGDAAAVPTADDIVRYLVVVSRDCPSPSSRERRLAVPLRARSASRPASSTPVDLLGRPARPRGRRVPADRSRRGPRIARSVRGGRRRRAARRPASRSCRRRSGGGAVLVVPDEMVWFDVVVPGDDARFARRRST